MTKSDTRRLIARLSILFTLLACVALFSAGFPQTPGWASLSAIRSQEAGASKTVKSQDRPFQTHIRVTTIQLQPDGGVIPVHLTCEDASLSAPNELESVSCVLRNKTARYISAGVLHTFIIVEKDGRTSSDSGFLAFDTSLHPDTHAESRPKLVPPGGEYRLDDLPVSYDGNVNIRGLTVQIDYVEFAGSTSLGPNQAGSRIIADTRDGAAKYKNWLVKKYNQNGKSINALVPLLDKSLALPEELDIQNSEQKQGVMMYRNFARRTYETKGSEGLAKRLKQISTSVNE